MNAKQRKILAGLTSNGQRWLCISNRVPNWVQDSARSEPWRPTMCIVLDLDADQILHFQLGKRKDSHAQVAMRTLVETMTTEFARPDVLDEQAMVTLIPGRPAHIDFTRDETHRALKVELDALGIASHYTPNVAGVNAMMRDMAGFSDNRVEPGIMTTLSGNVIQAQRFFAAAARFYAAAPWEIVANAHVIEVRYPPAADPFWAVIMGNGGEAFGIALYESLSVVNRMFDNGPGGGREVDQLAVSVMYGLPYDGATSEDLDAIEQFGFPVADYDAYPMILHMRQADKEATLLPPTAQQVERFAALFQSLPEFVTSETHMDAESQFPKAADATLLLPEDDPHGQISLKFPPTGLTFRPPMLGDEDQDGAPWIDDGTPPSIDDLLTVLSSLFGEPPKARSTAGAKHKPAAKKPVKKRKS